MLQRLLACPYSNSIFVFSWFAANVFGLKEQDQIWNTLRPIPEVHFATTWSCKYHSNYHCGRTQQIRDESPEASTSPNLAVFFSRNVLRIRDERSEAPPNPDLAVFSSRNVLRTQDDQSEASPSPDDQAISSRNVQQTQDKSVEASANSDNSIYSSYSILRIRDEDSEVSPNPSHPVHPNYSTLRVQNEWSEAPPTLSQPGPIYHNVQQTSDASLKAWTNHLYPIYATHSELPIQVWISIA